MSGGESADSSDSTRETFLCKARDKVVAFTEIVDCFSPCTIFAEPIFVPKALAREIASNAAIVLSEAVNLFFAVKRIGTNRDRAPECVIRWISVISASQLSVRTVLPMAKRQDSCFQLLGSADAMSGPASWDVSFRKFSSRYDSSLAAAHAEYSVPAGTSPLDSRWHLTGQARNASSKRDVTMLRRLLSGSYESRQLGSLHIKCCCRSTTKSSVLGTYQTISEIGSRILPAEKSLLDGRLILKSNIGRFEQARNSFNDQILR